MHFTYLSFGIVRSRTKAMEFSLESFMCPSQSKRSGYLDSNVSDVPYVTLFWYMINHLALELNTCSDLQKTGI